jgi:hypothetical protein
VREALDLAPETPVIALDARRRDQGLRALITLAEYLFRRQEAAAS